MKSRFKIVSLLLTALILVSIFSACDKTSEKEGDSPSEKSSTSEPTQEPDVNTTTTGDGLLPIVDEPLTLTMWWPIASSEQKTMTSLKENLVFQKLEERTGITIEFIHPPVGQEREQYNLMIASGELPDMIMHMNVGYPGGPDKAVEDGFYIRLNELVDQYAPNFSKIINSNEDIRKQILTDEKNLWGFPMVEVTLQGPWAGLVVRQDWLDDLEMETPVTFDDWYDMLKAFKDKKAPDGPLYIPGNGFHWDHSLIAGFGVAREFFQMDGEVKFGPIEDGFKEYITLLNQWYREGLIQENFATMSDEALTQLIITGGIGVWQAGFYVLNHYATLSEDEDYRLLAIPTPVKNVGDKAHLRQTNFYNRGYDTVITKDCKNPVEAVKWFDYIYSDEGYILTNYGIEGKTFNLVDGEYLYTDIITNNPDGLTVNDAMHVYAIQHGPILRDWERELYTYTDDELNAEHVWAQADSDWVMPMITPTADEGSRVASILSNVNTYVSEMALQFIIGSEPMDRYDEFVNQIKQMDIEEAISLQQDALDRYNSR